MGRRLGLLATSLVLVLGFAPATAGAAFTATLDYWTGTATLTGDDAADLLTVAANESGSLEYSSPAFGTTTDWDTTMAGDQTVEANRSWRLVINPGGGSDSVTILTQLVRSVQSGLGSGDDRFQGASSDGDVIDGGAGNDRIAGGRGDDDVSGGDGNDTLVWDHGDNNDVFSGDGGFDRVEVNGAPMQGDAFHIRPEGPNVRLDRTNLVPFDLVVGPTTERLEVNGLGGEETITTEPGLAAIGVALALDGGTGDDSITGGDGADSITGGEDADTLAGGAGDDRMGGGRGNDSVAGGAGNDALLWSNGDGTDVADGDDGFDAMEVDGAAFGDEAFSVRPSGSRTRFDRTNLVPFGIDMSVEVLDLDMLGGNDAVTVSDGAGVLVDADGGSGEDTLTGGDGHDSLRGGADADTITGGPGSDAIDGDEGNDTIAARDGGSDVVRCGSGTDTATLDADSVDGAADCETADRPAPAPIVTPPAQEPGAVPAPAPAPASILTGRAKVTKRRARIRLACPAGATTCSGRLALSTARAVRIGRARVVVVLGTAGFTIPAGQQATVVVRLTRSLRAIAGRSRFLRTRAVADTAASDGTSLGTTRRVKLVRGKRW